jgi:hypothetical protein
MYFYRASAVDIGGTIATPVQHVIEPQATSSLPLTGGQVSRRVEKFNDDGLISFDLAYSELSGSFDATSNVHTTSALSVIQGLNIAGIVTVDRVVSRSAVISPKENSREPSFSITGSHFENVRVAGHAIQLSVATQRLHQLDTYSKFEQAYTTNEAPDLLPWGHQTEKGISELEKLEAQYCRSQGIGKGSRAWASREVRQRGGPYWCSAAGHLDIKEQIGNSELRGFGAIIFIPRIGLIYLAEMLIDRSTRQLNMIRVELDSPRRGSIVAGTTVVNGTRDPVPLSAPAVLTSARDDDSERLGKEFTQELLQILKAGPGVYVPRKRDIFTVDVEIAVQRFEILFRTAEVQKIPLYCFKAKNGVPIPIAARPPEAGNQRFPVEPWLRLRNLDEMDLALKDPERLQVHSSSEVRDFFEQRLQDFVTDRFRARQSDISELPGLPVRVRTHSHGLMAYYSPAYFFDDTQVLNGPTTPTVGWIQPGRYVFGAGRPGKPADFDLTAEYRIPAGSDHSPLGEYRISAPTEVFLNL